MFISGTGPVRCHISFKVLTQISRMILQIFDVPSWHYFEDMGYTCICINMKKYLVCQTIDYVYADVYDYEYKELSIPFWSICLSSPLKYFMGVWSFVIVYFQNKSLLKCTSLWQLSFFILYWYWFVVTLTIRFLNITCFWKFFSVIKKSKNMHTLFQNLNREIKVRI